MKIFVKKLSETAKLPTHGSDYAAGYDVYADLPEGNVGIFPGMTEVIGTGLSIMPEDKNYYFTVNARSGLATKEGLRPANCVGICDWDYRGEYKVALHNDSKDVRIVEHGQKIAQIILQKSYDCEFEEVDELVDTERGDGGFGHTGKF